MDSNDYILQYIYMLCQKDVKNWILTLKKYGVKIKQMFGTKVRKEERWNSDTGK